jgi:epoxyqueuosine reductase QueG
MKIDEANRIIVKTAEKKGLPSTYITYCRACELVCPLGKYQKIRLS